MSFLEQKHIDKIFETYQAFKSQQNFAALVNIEEVLENKGNMAINLYVRTQEFADEIQQSFEEAYQHWEKESQALQSSMNELFQILEN